MNDRCDQCGADKTANSAVCQTCGKQFVSSPEDILQRPANAWAAPTPPTYTGSPIPPAHLNAAAKPIRQKPASWLSGSVVAAVVCVVVVIGLVFWGGYKLWMAGPGGDLAYRQYNALGDADYNRGDYASANREYSRMIALRPQGALGYWGRGRSEFMTKDFAATIADETTGIPLTKTSFMHGEMLVWRGAAQFHQNNYKQAISDYSLAFPEFSNETNPKLTSFIPKRIEDLYRRRGFVYFEDKDYPACVGDFTAAIAFGHNNPDDYFERAKSELWLDEPRPAADDINHAFSLAPPSHRFSYYRFVDAIDKRKQYDLAVTVFQRAASGFPDDIWYWGSLGWDQYETGQWPQAIVADNHALSLSKAPNLGWIRFNLALTYAALGQNSLADKAYTDALANCRPRDIPGAVSDLKKLLAKHPDTPLFQMELLHVEQEGKPPSK